MNSLLQIRISMRWMCGRDTVQENDYLAKLYVIPYSQKLFTNALIAGVLQHMNSVSQFPLAITLSSTVVAVSGLYIVSGWRG